MPIALFLLALVGTLWSDAPWGARSYALSPATKLLVLPLLFYHFERSSRGMWVFVAFLVSCALLMVMSWLVLMYPGLTLKPDDAERGIFVKNYIDQSQEFALCAVVLAYPVITLLRDRKIWQALLLVAIAASLRRQHGVRHRVAHRAGHHAGHARGVRADAPEMANQRHPVLGRDRARRAGVDRHRRNCRRRRTSSRGNTGSTRNSTGPTSIGLRLEFWEKSLRFFAEAPIVGHGTGSTRGLFEAAATGPAVLAQGAGDRKSA